MVISLQGVSASRKELVKYDQRKLHHSLATPTNVEPSIPFFESSPSLSRPPVVVEGVTGGGVLETQGMCFGCISASTEHCITLLRALSMRTETRRHLVEQVYATCFCSNILLDLGVKSSVRGMPG